MAEFSLSTLKKKTGGDMGLFDPMWKRIHKKVGSTGIRVLK